MAESFNVMHDTSTVSRGRGTLPAESFRRTAG
jgi:hypothetical protein